MQSMRLQTDLKRNRLRCLIKLFEPTSLTIRENHCNCRRRMALQEKWTGLLQPWLAQHRDQRAKDGMVIHLYNIEVKGRPIRRGCLFWWVGSRLLPLSQHILTPAKTVSAEKRKRSARAGSRRARINDHFSTVINILILSCVTTNRW